MTNKRFLKFLQEISEKDKLEAIFPITAYMDWAGIPSEQLHEVLENVTNELQVLMNYLCTFKQNVAWWKQTKFARIVTSFTLLVTVVSVEFAEWTKDVREQEDWLLKIVEEMEKNNEHSRIY